MSVYEIILDIAFSGYNDNISYVFKMIFTFSFLVNPLNHYQSHCHWTLKLSSALLQLQVLQLDLGFASPFDPNTRVDLQKMLGDKDYTLDMQEICKKKNIKVVNMTNCSLYFFFCTFSFVTWKGGIRKMEYMMLL